jgi:DNA-binding transcriptional regulator GbsR (MarR family)
MSVLTEITDMSIICGVMTEQEAEFVEQVGVMLSAGGMPRMAGRLWAWLLICEPPEQTAADLADALHASRGSISGMTRLLLTVGLIRKSTRRGDRREYFSVPPGATIGILRARHPQTIAWRQLAERGLELLAHRSPESRGRLQEVRDVYAFMERELPAMLDRFEKDRDRLHTTKEGTT